MQSSLSLFVLTAGLYALPAAAQGTAGSGSPQVADAPPAFSDVRVLLWQTGVKNAYPRWSADGRQVLYQSNRTGKWHVHVMDADGKNDRALTSGSSNNNFPDWSPDNQRVAFVSDRDGNEEIYVMRMDGSELANLSRDPARDIHPYWTPDGRALLFNSTRGEDRLQIWEVAGDGTGLRRLVDSPDDDTCARVDPTGEHILYLANLAGGKDDVLLRKRDGSEPLNLTNDYAPDGWPTWAPDGRIVYCSARQARYFHLYVMDGGGGEPRQLTFAQPPFADARPAVSPDGERIVFNREDDRTIGICVVELPAPGAAQDK